MRRITVVLVVSMVSIVLLSTVACVPPVPPSNQPPAISSFEALGAPHIEPALVPLMWAVADPEGDNLTCRLDADGDGTWEQTFAPCQSSAGRNVTATAGPYTARLEVSDGTQATVRTASYSVAPATTVEGFDIVIRPSTPVDTDLLAALERAASRWETAVVRGLPDMAVTLAAGQCSSSSGAFNGVVDDLVVDVSMHDVSPYGALGAPCVFGPDLLPRFGSVQFHPDRLPDFRAFDLLDEIALHELTHVLGFGTIWNFGRDFVSGGGNTELRFVGPRAMAEYSLLGGSGGIPLAAVNGIPTGHWEPNTIGVEVMSMMAEGFPLSRLTIASIADLGFAVDLNAADAYSLPDPPSAMGHR